MGIIKKEWKTIVFALWLLLITYFLISLNGKLSDVNRQEEKAWSTLDSVESVVISTDANIADIGKKVDAINSNVEFVVSKVRRR